jgi:hypothetical protein
MTDPIYLDWSASGGPDRITVADATQLAAKAKTKVKDSRIGWSKVSHLEILALAWMADRWLKDCALDVQQTPKKQPPVISDL